VFWVISVYFNVRNTLPKSGTFLLGHPVYVVKLVGVTLYGSFAYAPVLNVFSIHRHQMNGHEPDDTDSIRCYMRDFSLRPCLQTGFTAHSYSHSVGIRVNRPNRKAQHSFPFSVIV
jgi:hypothetical protein